MLTSKGRIPGLFSRPHMLVWAPARGAASPDAVEIRIGRQGLLKKAGSLMLGPILPRHAGKLNPWAVVFNSIRNPKA